MFTHESIWLAIDRLAQSAGYSTSGLAKKAGLDPTTFNKSKRFSGDGKERWPSTESIAKILAVTGMAMSDFAALVDEGTARLEKKSKENNPVRRLLPFLPLPQATRADAFDKKGLPASDLWDEMPFPDITPEENSAIYLVEINNNSFAPFYREGDFILLSPRAAIRRGDRVLVTLNSGHAHAGEVVRISATKVDIKTLGQGGDTVSIAADTIGRMARIIWASQ